MSPVARPTNQAYPVALALLAGVALVLVVLPVEAHAQEVLDTIVDKFKGETSKWETAIKAAAISLFWILAAIEFAVSAIFLALSGAGAQTFAAEIVKRILMVGIFFFILDNGTSIADAIIQSFRQLSKNAGGVEFAPSAIFNSGLNIAQKVVQNVSFWSDTSKSVGLIIAALVVVFCFALLAAIVIVTIVEMYIVTYAGIILLGFGGSNFTKDYAVKYLTYAVSVGLKLMVMALVVSIGEGIITSIANSFSNSSTKDVFTVVGVAVVLLAVTKALPSMLQSIVVGSSVGSNTALAGVAATAAGATVGTLAGGAAVTGAAMAGGGSVGQMAGRAIGAVGQAAFDRAAGIPGSRMGSVMGNAAFNLRQSNQAARLATPSGVSRQSVSAASGNAGSTSWLGGRGSGRGSPPPGGGGHGGSPSRPGGGGSPSPGGAGLSAPTTPAASPAPSIPSREQQRCRTRWLTDVNRPLDRHPGRLSFASMSQQPMPDEPSGSNGSLPPERSLARFHRRRPQHRRRLPHPPGPLQMIAPATPHRRPAERS